MSGKVVEEIEVQLKTTKAKRKAREFKGTLEGAFAKGAIAAKMAEKAFKKVQGAITASFRSALLFDRTVISLKTALELQGREVERNTELFNKQAATLEFATGVSEELIRSLQQKAISLDVSNNRVRNYITASMALARVLKIDVKTAFAQLIKSTNGLVEETLAQVSAVKSLTKEQLESGEAIDVINDKYGKFALEGASGSSGAVAQLTLGFENVGKEIAKIITQSELFLKMTRVAAISVQGLANMIAGGEISFEKMAEHMLSLSGWTFGPEEKPGFSDRGPPQTMDFTKGIVIDEGEERKREERLKNEKGHRENLLRMTEHYDKLRLEMVESQSEYVLRVARLQSQEEIAIEEEKERRKLEIVRAFSDELNRAVMGSFEALITGSEISGKEIAFGLVRGIGQSLVAQGVSDTLRGTGMLLVSGGLNPMGHSLIAHGGTEVATGLAFMGGSYALSRAGWGGGGGSSRRSAGGGGVGGAGAGGGAFSGLFARQTPERYNGRSGQPLTIVFNGPTTAPAVGVAIKQALAAAQQEGMIR